MVIDSGNNMVKIINATTGRLSSIAGSGASIIDLENYGLQEPSGIIVEAETDSYLVADTRNNVITKIKGSQIFFEIILIFTVRWIYSSYCRKW